MGERSQKAAYWLLMLILRSIEDCFLLSISISIFIKAVTGHLEPLLYHFTMDDCCLRG